MFDVDVDVRARIPAALRLVVMRAEQDGSGGGGSSAAHTQVRLRADRYGVDGAASTSDSRHCILQGTETS